jgi:hypothetical protein
VSHLQRQCGFQGLLQRHRQVPALTGILRQPHPDLPPLPPRLPPVPILDLLFELPARLLPRSHLHVLRILPSPLLRRHHDHDVRAVPLRLPQLRRGGQLPLLQ